jgi:hypothetical protein
MPLVARFYQKVKVGKPSECWEWQGAIIRNGYGQIGKHGQKAYYAHRISYELHKGPIPEGMYVCHSCDNKKCVNPNHLWVGTAADNSRDARVKGLTPRGGGKKKLTPEAVSVLRSGANVNEICIQYGVSDSACYAARSRKTWRHLNA